MTGPHGRPVLLAAAGLHMVTQSALAPFYPALFRAAYGVEALAATGLFLVVCQVSAVVALPLWGRATRRVPLARLVTAGQSAAVLLAAGLVLAPSYAVFTGVSVLLVAAKAVVLLAYPGLARSHPRGVLPGVVQYVAVLHAASVAATLLGGLVVAVPEPRTALPLLALLEAVLLVACLRLLRPRRDAAPAAGTAPGATAGAAATGRGVDGPAGGIADGAGHGSGAAVAAMWRPALYVLLTAVAVYAARPYFTEYAVGAGASAGTAALLFVLPHVAVLALLPAAAPLRARLGGRRLLRYGMLVAAAGLCVQAALTDAGWLAAARLVFGAGLALGQVALDERVITTTGSGAAYSVVAMGQTAGLLLAPLVATGAATAALWAPLLVGGALLGALALAAPVGPPPPAPPTAREGAPRSPRAVPRVPLPHGGRRFAEGARGRGAVGAFVLPTPAESAPVGFPRPSGIEPETKE